MIGPGDAAGGVPPPRSGRPDDVRHGLPTEAGLRRLGRRLMILVGVVLAAAAVVSVVSGPRPTVLVVAGFALVLGTGFALGEVVPGDLAKREVLTAGSRGRRRRLRWALLRGRTGVLDDDDLRTCHHLAPVVRARSRVLLRLNATALLGVSLILLGYLTDDRTAAPGWLLLLALVTFAVAVSELAVRAVEARSAGRFPARGQA
ncbi:hypothetical protein [Nocardioides sp. CFH 31398]|uniref:hypothetical protein n=1 Tax=Nocardioides sp. CFH 31398 TaxID=2919579 RepID=UPI001F055B6A|nr:hypothetical protein [Nocardioides sp. CFH 31398]MCH1865619.1 hypothetical protein [Nocardioides sp. CFH 31398]